MHGYVPRSSSNRRRKSGVAGTIAAIFGIILIVALWLLQFVVVVGIFVAIICLLIDLFNIGFESFLPWF